MTPSTQVDSLPPPGVSLEPIESQRQIGEVPTTPGREFGSAGDRGVDRTLSAVLRERSTIAQAIVLAGVLGLLYWRIAGKLVSDWYNIGDESHGFLVPFFALFLVWDKRRKLAALPVQPTWTGLPLVVLGAFTLLLGVYGAELFLSRISFVMILAGLLWTLAGRRIFQELLFPMAVLLLAIPFPAILFNQITFPLQLLASRMASAILPLLGVPVLREGNVIQLPAMKLEVAEACSGIRSLMSLFTLSVFYGYFLERTTARRWIMALASIPIAVGANALRIVGTGLCVQYWDPSKGEGFFHEFSGWVMFLISLGFLYFVHRALQMVRPARVRA